MKNSKHYVLIAALLLSIPIFAQEELKLTKKDSIVKSSWMLGLGYNFVDDSGDVTDGLFNFDEEWNSTPYPNRLSLGRYFKSGIGLAAIATYNTYKEGKIIDGVVATDDIDYLGFDARITYDLNKLIGETAWFDPYVGGGLGYTDANNIGRGTYNAVVGFRTWFSDRVGLDFSSSGKWAIGNNGATNHLQHAVGVVYQFGIEKGLSKKGEEKLALIQAQEKEKQRVMDSIANANRIKEKMLLAEKLAKEKETARLAAIEKEKVDAYNKRKKELESKINDLGYVYFNLNSSYLTKSSKTVLNNLVVILDEFPSLTLRVTSHTDSRGTSTYNKWLSERRVTSTKDYLVKKGVSEDRLEIQAYGEEKLLNDCSDGVYCPEDKHKVNRRSEFIVLDF
ncbi:outer membrane protein OmpA-like peptidoglycan-associated protein [Maribacter vaceletii]|uniref:Outer membrane protein OmpA-like peptidoglycan-associated protein n=1 Tax=Maribacter vaceletii TaxID=1206816 RepID=A0A495DSQ4_9FLAO|nr:OmpA family protein [Maribacter vaceletii]RKR07166.1 outer membrane protein OmpA-like peptidoglycan-associated protein [Maribacter vaceletii]